MRAKVRLFFRLINFFAYISPIKRIIAMSIKNYNVHPAIYFIVAAVLLSYFFPREGKFKYQFYEGKPWRYGLLTASTNFPVYKAEERVKAEQDSVLKKFQPYYRVNPDIEVSQIDKLRADYNAQLKHRVTSAYMQYIERMLQQLYTSGIVSSQDWEKLHTEQYSQINLIRNTLSSPHYVSDLFTVKTAYEFIINNCPANLNRSLLQSCDINNYLVENVTYDAATSDKVRNELIQSVPISSGIIQAGERIVDRGEIVTPHTYNVLRSLKIIYESQSGGNQRHNLMLAGQVTLVFGLLFCYWLYLFSFRRKILFKRRNTLFLVCCIFVPVLLTEVCAAYNLFSLYIIPFAISPIVVRTFFDSRTALFTHLVTVLICSVMAQFPHEFLILQIIAGMVVTFSLKDLSERSQLIRCAFFVFLSYALSYIGLVLYQDADLNKIHWVMMLYFGINFILLTFAYLLVYMLEKVFGYISPITLVELSNINNDVLKKLSETCPGTFQHSLQVSILASEAASRIGANAQLVRTGAMYHDIGKMSNPLYFTENQNQVNPHSALSFEESAQRVISHVTEGVKIAEKAGLPKEIIDFIRTHHGRGKAKYFYNSYKNQYPDRPVDDSLFTYPGPNPFTKETAIVMMADSVEAASRSLKEHTEESISQLVNKIIDTQIADGLLKNAPMTFRDVESVKRVFIEKLKIMYHTRISYPDLKKGDDKKEVKS